MREAELLVTNANLITLDLRRPRARAMAISDGKILALGEEPKIARWAGQNTKKLDAQGKTIVPGFIDCHLHLMWYGEQLLRQADLVGCTDIDDLLQRLSQLAHRRPGDGWLQGHGFDQEKMRDRRFPTRDDLDRVSRTRPIIVSRICGHAAVVNSAALALVSDEQRRAGNETTGLFTEERIHPFYRRIPQMSEEEMEEAVLVAANLALRTGITSVHTMLDVPRQMVGYSRLRRKNRLPIRVTANPPYAAVESLHANGISTGFGDDWLRVGAAKLFSDGSLGAQTAWLRGPYADKPETRGLRIYEPEELKRKCADAQSKGFQLAIHAIGDQALRETLDAIEFALDGADNREHRHRVEHASLCPPDCLERLAARQVVVTLQPQFVTSDTWTDQRIGLKRVPFAYPFRSMAETGVPIALSSDCPVERLDAFACLAAAVGGHPWRPGQTLTIEQALHAYCLGSAYAGFGEQRLGSLEPGKLADFVVLSEDIMKVAVDQIRGIRAERVFVNGREIDRS